MNSPLNPSVSWFGPDYANGQLAMVYTGYWFSGQLRGMATNPEEPVIGESMEAGHYQMHPMFTWKGVTSASQRLAPSPTRASAKMTTMPPGPPSSGSWRARRRMAAPLAAGACPR